MTTFTDLSNQYSIKQLFFFSFLILPHLIHHFHMLWSFFYKLWKTSHWPAKKALPSDEPGGLKSQSKTSAKSRLSFNWLDGHVGCLVGFGLCLQFWQSFASNLNGQWCIILQHNSLSVPTVCALLYKRLHCTIKTVFTIGLYIARQCKPIIPLEKKGGKKEKKKKARYLPFVVVLSSQSLISIVVLVTNSLRKLKWVYLCLSFHYIECLDLSLNL